MGRFATVKALLSATPPQAVLISPPSDMLEESVLRSTSGGTLSSAITGLDSRIAIHSEKMAAGRMPPATAFDGGDGDLAAPVAPVAAAPTAANALVAFGALL